MMQTPTPTALPIPSCEVRNSLDSSELYHPTPSEIYLGTTKKKKKKKKEERRIVEDSQETISIERRGWASRSNRPELESRLSIL